MGQSVRPLPFQLIVSGHASVGSGDPESHNFRRNGTGPDYRKPRVLLIWAFKEIYYFGCPGFPLSATAVDFLDILVQYKCLRYCSVYATGRNIGMERSETQFNDI